MVSIEFKLEQEHGSRITDCLRKDSIRLGPEAEKAFIRNVEASIVNFLDQKTDPNVTYRQIHSALRALWRLSFVDDVSMEPLRIRLCSLPKQVTEFLHAREIALKQADTDGYGFLQWVKNDDAESFKNVVRALSADGAKFVTRSRGRGRRSGARLEPLILGHARGAADGAHEGGRPSHDAQNVLVAYSASDWMLATLGRARGPCRQADTRRDRAQARRHRARH